MSVYLTRTIMDCRDEIVEAMARAIWVSAYITASHDDDDLQQAGPGEDWYDVVPDTPLAAHDVAEQFATELERTNQLGLIYMFDRAAHRRGKHDRPPTPEEFGAMLVAESQGSGVRWGDNHPEHGFKVPRNDCACAWGYYELR